MNILVKTVYSSNKVGKGKMIEEQDMKETLKIAGFEEYCEVYVKGVKEKGREKFQ